MVNMRPFNSFEQENIKFLVNHNVKFTQVEVTSTGLKRVFWTPRPPCGPTSWRTGYTTIPSNNRARNTKLCLGL